MGIGLNEGIDWGKCCKQNSLIPSPPPNSCPLVLDGTGDSLTWADSRATSIAPFTMDFAMDFWFNNKLTTARDFTLLSLGKEISGQFYDTIELKYKSATNELIVELKGDLAGSTTYAVAKFELARNTNSPITGLANVDDKWVECAGNVALHNFVHLFLSVPSADSITNVLDATLINIWWNGQPLTASFTESSLWDVNSSYYINFLTLGDYRGPNTPATASAAHADIHNFVWRDSYYPSNTTAASLIHNNGYPRTTVYLFNWYAYGIVGTAPQGTPVPTDLFIANGNPLSAQLNDNASVLCGPVIYSCAPTPPPAAFTFTVKSTDYHPLPANCDNWIVNVFLNGTLVCEVVKDSSAVATVTNPSFQVTSTDVVQVIVTALAPTGPCSSQYSTTEVFMQTGYGNSNVIPYTTRLNFTSTDTQWYEFSPVENVEDTINIYGTPIV